MNVPVTPKISVVVPVLNGEKYIGRCIRSLMAQSFNKKDYEILVVNDGSSDNTKYALEIFGEEIRVLTHSSTRGLPSALNTGIRAAKGQYLIRVDADDYVHAEYLNFLFLYLNLNPDVDAVACDYIEVDDREIVLERKNCIKYPIGCGIMFRMEQLVEIGLYDEEFLLNEEKELRIRFEKKFKIYQLPMPLYRYRKHRESITNDLKGLKKFSRKIVTKHGPKKKRGKK